MATGVIAGLDRHHPRKHFWKFFVLFDHRLAVPGNFIVMNLADHGGPAVKPIIGVNSGIFYEIGSHIVASPPIEYGRGGFAGFGIVRKRNTTGEVNRGTQGIQRPFLLLLADRVFIVLVRRIRGYALRTIWSKGEGGMLPLN